VRGGAVARGAIDGTFVFPDPGVPRIPLDRLDDIHSPEAARYVAEFRPFVTRVDWKAVQWTPDYLKQKVGEHRVPLRTRAGGTEQVTIAKFLDLVENQKQASSEYVMHNYPIMKIWGFDGLNTEMEPLLADIDLPSFIPRDKIQEMYVWARNMGWYDNKSHCEPNLAAAINVQLRGKKHVGLLGAASPREEMMGPPFFSAGQTVYAPSAEHPEFAKVRCYETVLEAGDAVHIPPLWYHWFVHYDVYQMNVNVWWTTPSLQVSPVTAEWSFMAALCLSLGGFRAATEKFAALPMETQELLAQIAKTLIEDRRCTNVPLYQSAKRDAPKIAIDPKEFTKKLTDG
jgi:hypothetical protein